MAGPNGLFDQVNYIKKFISNPCDAPWTVYLELFFPAFGKAILTILTFGMDDVMRGYFRPKGVRGPWHRRKGRKGKARFRGIPEIGEAVGSHLPGAESVRGRSVTHGVKHMWMVDGVLQRVLWYWLLVDVVVTGLFEWTSMINKTEFCTLGFPNALAAHGSGGSAIPIVGWGALTLPDIDYLRGATTWNVSTGSVPAGEYQVAVGLKFTNIGPNQTKVILGIFPTPIPVNPYDISEEVVIPILGSGEAIASAEITGPASFTILWKSFSSTVVGNDGFVMALQFGD